ncbi:potassium channel family protein [Thorsellia anophelis]|uniref:Trk system potassium uptake protein TrkA n=1 Tax=Thorsellia anophelis DSM 18579 TaxID=1123402 RepID=A0A1I0ADT8_9GAMM|nr:TrkA family potassium uptake protein [Thorsellia anophelis]SES91401.1 trk system potassium uptake protein TrkA [Thorsellia anophelis DSM 18579]
MSHFTVIGLGRFGITTSLELIRLGHTVTGVDSNPKIVEKYVDHLTQSIVCDASDLSALHEIDILASDVVVVAIGSDMQASLMTVLALQDIGAKTIWVKSNTKAHQTIVSKLGVAKIIHPEEDMGIHVAQSLNYPMVEDYIAMGNGIYVVTLHISPNLAGQTLGTVLLDAFNDVHPMALKRHHEIITPLNHESVLHAHDKLLLVADHLKLKSIANAFT